MKDCIFCKITDGDIPSFKVHDDNDFIGILDINPNTKGVTLVIPKKHFSSYIFGNDDTTINKLMKISKKIAKKIERSLNVKRVAVVLEGMGVDHLHVKLYPLHGLKDGFVPMEHGIKKVHFDEYPGYITTQLGEQADFEELKKLAEKINAN
jgi:histidine triad (HIT) family protein